MKNFLSTAIIYVGFLLMACTAVGVPAIIKWLAEPTPQAQPVEMRFVIQTEIHDRNETIIRIISDKKTGAEYILFNDRAIIQSK